MDGARGRERGAWLTYRYRLGGPEIAPAAGTIKAPSFLDAARRLLARRAPDGIGAAPAYLRLRAAGEDEVVLRVARHEEGGGRWRLDVVPPDAFRFATSDDGDRSV